MENYLFLNLKRYKEHQSEIEKSFYSEASDLLVAEYSDNSKPQQLLTVLNSLSKLLHKKPHKKIIFITQESELAQFKENLNSTKLSDSYLELPDKAFAWDDLTLDSQCNLLAKRVNFQGNYVVLNQLIDECSAKTIIDPPSLLTLIDKNEIVVGAKLPISSGYDESYYIDRNFNYQIKIKEEILKANRGFDLLAISGTSRDALAGLVSPKEKIRRFNEPDSDISKPTRFILLDNQDKVEDPVQFAEKNFNQLCQQFPQQSLHWLTREASNLVWQRSQGTLSALRQYIDKDHTLTCPETMFISQENRHIVTIVSDKPGMGKSTILTHLSRKIKENSPTVWVVRFDLNDCTDELKMETEKPSFNHNNADETVNFLSNKLLKNELKLNTPLEQVLFKQSFNRRGKIVVLFDGFDEISPMYKEIVIDLLQALKNSAVKQLWVTTRPHMRVTLEDKLQQFSYTLEPFSEKNQIAFLTKFWQQRLKSDAVNKERLAIYPRVLLKHLAQSIRDREKEFTGIPLQTKMLAEVFEADFKAFNKSQQKETSFLKKLSLLDLYDDFVDKKFNIYFEYKTKMPVNSVSGRSVIERDLDNLKPIHQKLALEELFNEQKEKLFDTYKFENKEKKGRVCNNWAN